MAAYAIFSFTIGRVANEHVSVITALSPPSGVRRESRTKKLLPDYPIGNNAP